MRSQCVLADIVGARAQCDKARLLFIPERCVETFDRRENGVHGGQHRVHSAVGHLDQCDRIGWNVAGTSGPQNLCLMSSVAAQLLQSFALALIWSNTLRDCLIRPMLQLPGSLDASLDQSCRGCAKQAPAIAESAKAQG